MYAKVIVDLKTEDTDELYTYKIPEVYQDLDLVGARVLVEFGFQKVLGYVIEVTDESEFSGSIKPLTEVIDYSNEINYEQIELAKYLKATTLCTTTQALQTMVPSFLRAKSRKFLTVVDYGSLDAELALLFENKKKISMTADLMPYYAKIRREIARGTIEMSYDVYSYGKQKRIKEYYIDDKGVDKLINKKRKDVYEYLYLHPYSPMNKILEEVEVSDVTVKLMEKEGIIKSRQSFQNREYELSEPRALPKLNTQEEQIIQKYFETQGKPYLLHTNDNEFKYNALIQMIKSTLNKQKRVLILTPTIFSYNETVLNLRPFLSNYRILGFNSRMSNNDYYENYNTLKKGDVDVVITTKIGLFLPLADIGLIIMIDEDNYNYLNEQTPKFDSHLVLLQRAIYHQSRIVFTSDVPLVTTFHNVMNGQYYLLKNINIKKNLPIKIDVRSSSAEYGIPSEILETIKKNFFEGKKSMIVLNRKGYSKNIVCRDCGTIMRCHKCKMPLTYYKDQGTIKCNYCGTKETSSLQCQNCGSNDMMMLGLGLEQVKEKLEFNLPRARVLQIDSEILENTNGYEEVLRALDESDYDIIVGTSIITSLSSLHKMALVALLDCNSVLNINDYRAREECYRLIEKVTNFPNADIYIHGYSLDNPTINQAMNNDYINFYESEIETRNSLLYPPFYEINRLIITGQYNDIYYYANYFKKVYNNTMKDNKDIIGPAYLTTIKGVQLILKHQDFERVQQIIKEVNKKFSKYKLLINYERYPIRFY